MTKPRFPALAVLLALAACSAACPALPGGVDVDDPDDVVDPPIGVPEFSDRGPRPETPFVPARARLRLLLEPQYKNAVRDLAGDAAANVAVAPADVPLNGFVAVGAGELAVSAAAVAGYEASAEAIAAAASADPASPLNTLCTPGGVDDRACFTTLATRLGRRAYRRSLANDEVARLADIAIAAATAYGDAQRGKEFLMLALVQSPHFLYLVERGDVDDPAEARRLTGPELATRLSFFLTNGPPSDELLDAAEAGALSSTTAIEAEARALLTEPRAKEALRAFFREKLQVALLPTLNRPDPALTPTVRDAMVEETLRTVDDIVWERDADSRALFTSTRTFVNDELAAFYGYPVPGSGAAFVAVDTPVEEGRAGILTQGAFLMRFAHPDRTSPTLRGKFIRESLLCQQVPAPPPEVVTTLPEPSEGDGLPRTTRERIEAHATDGSCKGCHAFIDPLGYSLEHFDQFGRYRTHEVGLPIDASASLDGDDADGAAAFMGALSHRSDVVSCLVRGLFRNATGHIEQQGEDPSLYDVDTAFISSGLRLQEALVAIATADAFGFVNTFDDPADDTDNQQDGSNP
jgi:hypothetical protein